jgi:protoporphyrinogen oxidase
MTRIAILGGGPAGVGAAFRLRRENKAEVVVFERNDDVGGNAATFSWNGHLLDHGSHRLHPATEPAILADIRESLGAELLDRPRHGRIRLLGRWVHFPLKPLDLALRLDKRFLLGTLRDLARKAWPRERPEEETFASVLERSLGRTICSHFYFPYAHKIWGLDPSELSAIQARRRVSAGSFAKLFGKVLRQLPGLRRPGTGRFFYPRGGFGRITAALADRARDAGATFRLRTRVTGLMPPQAEDAPWEVRHEGPDGTGVTQADHVWSTLPLPLALGLLPDVPAEVARARARIEYRAMVLVYVDLPVPRFTEFDAHYFPEEGISITRLSEAKNYAAREEPKDRTALCAELPCSAGDGVFGLPDAELGAIVARDLARAGIPLPAPPLAVTTRRLREAYPLYSTGYEEPLAVLDRFASGLPRFVTYGRQGLFAHDNTHHALAMAYAAAACFDGRRFDALAWARHRDGFARHVVED